MEEHHQAEVGRRFVSLSWKAGLGKEDEEQNKEKMWEEATVTPWSGYCWLPF